jgi:hypothetical protein
MILASVKHEQTFIFSKVHGNPSVIIKAFSILEDVTVQNVFDAIYKIDIRKRWDTVFAEFLQIDKMDDATDVIYFNIKVLIFNQGEA